MINEVIITNQYQLVKTKIKNDTILLSFKKNDDSLDILILVNDYLSLSLNNREILSEEINHLLDLEVYCRTYLQVMNKLKYRDYSIKEIQDYLVKDLKTKRKHIKRLIDYLLKYGYLDDQRYTSCYFENALIQLKGRFLIVKELRNKGISEDIINQFINQDIDYQDLAYKYACRVSKTIKNKSIKMKKIAIKQKLLARGFDADSSDFALSQLDFTDDGNNEEENLKMLAKKAKKRYEKKYNGRKLKQSLISYLMSKGFNYEDIIKIINEMEIDDE